MKIRVVTTASNAKAVQVIRYQNGKRVILQHMGSAHTEQELSDLKLQAHEWIKAHSEQLSIFPEENPNQLLYLHHSMFLGIKFNYYRELMAKIQEDFGFGDLPTLLNDLVAMRIFEPASKLRSLELMERYFNIKHSRKTYYKIAPQCIELKQRVEEKVVGFAAERYGFDFDIVFYDVTTLYFETFEEDELRKNGFSKDNKSQQPQILVALMVTKDGFPMGYEIFSGNTFEGHTFIPVIKNFINKNRVNKLTVVADAAMISSENIKQLNDNNLNYIVGARLGNISVELLKTIDANMNRENAHNIRLKTELGYLICSYSSVRYRKDLYEMNKQIEKAQDLVENPAKGKRLKFTKTRGQKIEINQKLIEKTKMLLGIKGYYTNIEENVVCNTAIIERYHELYKVEQAFRMSKSDLQTRPIFHFKEQPIQLHLLICFMALTISKHIELQTNISIRRFMDEAKKIVDGEVLNQITNKKITISANPTAKMLGLKDKLFPPH